MKNKIFFLAILTLMLAGTSCRKTYTCECSTTATIVIPGFGNFVLPSKSESKAYSKKMTKKQAESACEHEAETIQSIEDKGLNEGVDPDEKATVVSKCELE